MGKTVNSEKGDWFPSVSPDGKYLFFSSNRDGSMDLYWMDAGIIQELKKKSLGDISDFKGELF